ncbi:MAG: tyrosine--tRNA ligase [Oscillospiraceae bacterium]|nr:tyrosine--tRNA ligase [Oscillospiraceae bacterium]
MKLFDELTRRGLIAQMTHPEDIKDLLNNKRIKFYIGFDATADSLHIGHFLQFIVIKHMQRAGHTPIAILGTGTTMIGDPSGKTDMRKMLTTEEINYNADAFQQQIRNILKLNQDELEIKRNSDWLLEKNYIEFMREIGSCFSVNKMLTAECFKSRLEKGLSFIEFNYMLLQSYDFYHLFKFDDCVMQLGGDDQWSNILSGIDLIRRKMAKQAYGVTFTLLTTKDGKKMGKTEKGSIWLDPLKTSPYDFFQYWRNVSDDDVINCMKLLTFIDIEKIEEYEKFTGSKLNNIKQELAFNITEMVHGKEKAEECIQASNALFGKGNNFDNIPNIKLQKKYFEDDKINILSILTISNLCNSKSDARRVVLQGGISIDGTVIDDIGYFIHQENILKNEIIIKKGKKNYIKLSIE